MQVPEEVIGPLKNLDMWPRVYCDFFHRWIMEVDASVVVAVRELWWLLESCGGLSN